MGAPRPGAERHRLAGRAISAVLVASAAFLAAGLGTPLAASAHPVEIAIAPQARDTLKAGDRRCLSSRPGDCLAKPVPADEPHGAVCGMCHDLWKDQPLTKSARSCTGGGCHEHPETLTPFHRTVGSATLSQCTSCHLPHNFRVTGNGKECSTCHVAGGALVSWAAPPKPLKLPSGLTFRHDDHATVACGACHGSGPQHGTLKLTSVQACRSCHHTPPLSRQCTRCHDEDEVRETSFDVTTTLNIHIGSLDAPSRTIHFDHARHWQTNCAVCHTGGIDLGTAKGADCSGCHLEHHDPTADCSACHSVPVAGAHTRTAHLGCGGTGCHERLPAGIHDAPRTRQLCLACHRTLTGHETGRSCVDCHALPPAAPAAR
jgi:hypothetical protein